MAKVTFSNVGTQILGTIEGGEPLGLYKTMHGAKQAVTKAGHTYEKTPKAAPTIEPDGPVQLSDLSLDEMQAMVAEGMEVVKKAPKFLSTWRLKSVKLEDKGVVTNKEGDILGVLKVNYDAGNFVCEDVVDSKGDTVTLGRLMMSLKRGNWASKTDAEREEVKVKQAGFRAKREARNEDRVADKAEVESGEVSLEVSRARNAMARVNGFPRYRELERAAEEGDKEAIAAKAMIDKSCQPRKAVRKGRKTRKAS